MDNNNIRRNNHNNNNNNHTSRPNRNYNMKPHRARGTSSWSQNRQENNIVDDRQDGTVRVGSGDFNGRGRGSKCIGFLGFLHISEPNPHNSTETELHSSASSSSPSPMPVLSFPPSSSSSSSFSPRLVSASSTFNRNTNSGNRRGLPNKDQRWNHARDYTRHDGFDDNALGVDSHQSNSSNGFHQTSIVPSSSGQYSDNQPRNVTSSHSSGDHSRLGRPSFRYNAGRGRYWQARAKKVEITTLEQIRMERDVEKMSMESKKNLLKLYCEPFEESEGPQRLGERIISLWRTLASEDFKSNLGNDEKLCRICYEVPKDAVALPCRHLATCFYCLKKCRDCPICRTDIEERIQVYMS